MICLVSLFAAALVSLQCCQAATALYDGKNSLNNHLQANAPTSHSKRRVKPYVAIESAPPETAQLVAGSQLVLSCVALGKPTPPVQWLKNGEPLADYEESANEILSIHPSSVTQLTSKQIVTEANDGDQYTCVVGTGTNRLMASTTVYNIDGDEDEMMTLRALFHRPSKPIVTFFYNSIFQNVSTMLVLPCRVSSSGDTQVYWLFNDQTIYGNPRMRELPSGDLLVTSLEWQDMGKFTCMVVNMYGKESVSTFLYPLIG